MFFNASMWVTVARRKAALFINAINKRNRIFATDSPRTTKRMELNIATVAIKEKVVQAVLHLFSAETLYKNLCVPIRKRAIIEKLYQLSMHSSKQLNLPLSQRSHLITRYN
jgi:hypothetical protein